MHGVHPALYDGPRFYRCLLLLLLLSPSCDTYALLHCSPPQLPEGKSGYANASQIAWFIYVSETNTTLNITYGGGGVGYQATVSGEHEAGPA